MIIDDFKEILERYPEESQRPLKDNDLAFKMTNQFTDDLNEFVNDALEDTEKYILKISPGSRNNWAKVPWAGVANTDSTSTFNKGLFLYFAFDVENSKCFLSINQGNDSFGKKIRTKIADFLINIFKSSDFELFNGYSFGGSANKSDAIIIKEYDLDNLFLDDLKNEFRELVKIYEYLIPHHIDYLLNMDPLSKDIRKTEEPIIWKISAGDKNINDEDAWNLFKKDSIVGIGYQYDENIDYSTFKNKFALQRYLSQQEESNSFVPGAIWTFVNWIKQGDLIIVNNGLNKLAGIGVVCGEFIPSTKNNNKNDLGLNNIYPVNWFITPDDLEIASQFFASTPWVNMSEYGSYWNVFLLAIARNDSDLRNKILSFLYNSFYNSYLKDDVGNQYEIRNAEAEEINQVWNEILDKNKRGESISDDIWDRLIGRKNKIHKDWAGDIKSVIQKSNNYSEDEMNYAAMLLFETINNLLNTENDEERRNILETYNENDYSKDISTNRLSSILYYLDNSFYVINQKTVDTIEFLSWIFGEEISFKTNLDNYISNNKRYKKFLDKFAKLYDFDKFKIDDFVTFDIFCHWLCNKKLGNYIGEKADLLPITLLGDIDDYSKNCVKKTGGREYNPLKITSEFLESKLRTFIITEDILNMISASLNAGKHIILDGTPGTGKTELARKFSAVAEENKFIDGYVLTTATSDWSTFDTIGGLMPNKDGSLIFHQGKFLEAIEQNKWLIIDEINRADIDKAFGQLFTVLSGQDVELPYMENDNPIKIRTWSKEYCEHDKENGIYYIGSNWRIIGTMNVDDKDSLFDLSYAFMRRFMFIEVDLPSKEDYVNIIKLWGNNIDEYYLNKLIEILDIIKYRKLGPAIFKDMISYIKERDKLGSPDYNQVLGEAVDAYILPQLEGLNKSKINDIEEFLKEIELYDFISNKFDELKLDL